MKPGGGSLAEPPGFAPSIGEVSTVGGVRDSTGFHCALIRTLTLCLSGVGVWSSTITVAKKPESSSFERKSATCCAPIMNPRKASSPRRLMETESKRAPPGAALETTKSASRYAGWARRRY